MDRRTFLVSGGLVAVAGVAGLVRTLFSGGSGPIEQTVPRGSAATTNPPVSSSTTNSNPVAAPDTWTTSPAVTEPPPTSTTEASPTTTSLAAAAVAPIICKNAWGARPLAGELGSHSIERMTVHHTAVRLDRNSDAPGHIRGHQAFHQQSGWVDLAYHYMIDANGNIYEGRPFSAPGDTFTSYDPAGHFLVCCEGNFDQQDLPEAQLASLAAMLAWGSAAFGISPDTIGGHRDYASTTCPGTSLAKTLEDGTLLDAVVALLESGGVELTEACGTEGTALVSAIEAGTA